MSLNNRVIKGYLAWVYNRFKTTLVCRYNPPYTHSVFPAGALKVLVLRTRASRAQAGKPHDVQRIISTHSGSFVYLYIVIMNGRRI